MNKEFLSINQAAEKLGVHHATIRKMIRQERLRATRIGSAYRIDQAELARFINANATTTPQPPPRITPEEIIAMLGK